MGQHRARAHGAGGHRAGQRHRARRSTWIGALLSGILALALVAAVLTTAFLLRPAGEEASAEGSACPTEELVVAAVPAVAEVLTPAVEQLACETVRIQSRPTDEVSRAVLAGTDVPDAWIPDSRLALAPLQAATARTPDVLLDSLARTPVVLASAGGGKDPDWQALLDPSRALAGDPTTDSATTAALLAAVADLGQQQVVQSVVPLAQAAADQSGPAGVDERLDRVLAEGGGRVAPVTEQAALAADSPAGLSVPGGRTAILDHPVLLTSGEAPAEAFTALLELLGTDVVADGLADAGFRTDQAPRPEGGVGEVAALDPGPQDVDRLHSLWTTLSVPTRALAVVDVSGSMNFTAGDSTRVDLTVAAARSGLELFPDSAAIGLWAFSHRLEGDRDHRTLVPVRRLAAPAGGAGQRALLDRALADLPDLVDGGTGLHDTVLAAYRTATRDHDPDAANTVLVFTDGTNEDPGSISERELLQRLRKLHDPERPVRVIAIGISADADARVLHRIAAATGGAAYVARRPQDMAEVFRTALAARTGE